MICSLLNIEKTQKHSHTEVVFNFRVLWSDLQNFCELAGAHEPEINNLSVREKES